MGFMTLRAVLVIALVAAVTGATALAFTAANPGDPRHGQFRVDGPRIVDPRGRAFVVKGVVWAYGTFAGGNGGGTAAKSERAAPRDLDRLRRLGVNTVRIFTSAPQTGRAGVLRRLDRLVRLARARGLVVEVATAYTNPEDALPWLRTLARRYRDDPSVWLQPMNEPKCGGGQSGNDRCGDWPTWQREHRGYVRAIRGAGMRSPIVVNTPSFSWDLSQADRYPLGDPNIVYGAHRYANDNLTFSKSERDDVEKKWAPLAKNRAVIVDEIGNWDGPQFRNSERWTRDFVRYVRAWVDRRGGSGAIAFNWRWSDPNTMVDGRDRLTPWGRIFAREYLARVPGSR
jgi:hypothetical protein